MHTTLCGDNQLEKSGFVGRRQHRACKQRIQGTADRRRILTFTRIDLQENYSPIALPQHVDIIHSDAEQAFSPTDASAIGNMEYTVCSVLLTLCVASFHALQYWDQ